MVEAGSLIRDRRSIRKYLSRPVTPALVAEILAEARWAPSAGNTQSTHVYIVTGEALRRVRAGLKAGFESGAPPAPDVDMPVAWPEPYKTRMATRFERRSSFVAAGSPPSGDGGPAAPPWASLADVFGAPVLLLIAVDREVASGLACFDAGLMAQTIALSAHARGLGSCIMTSIVRHPDSLRAVLPQLAGKALIAALALGYPDPDAAVNRFPRERISTSEFVTAVE